MAFFRNFFNRSGSREEQRSRAIVSQPAQLTFTSPCHLNGNEDAPDPNIVNRIREMSVNADSQNTDEFLDELDGIIQSTNQDGREGDGDGDEEDEEEEREGGEEREQQNEVLFMKDNMDRLIRFLLVGTDRGMYTCRTEYNGINVDDERLVACVVELVKRRHGKAVLEALKEYNDRVPRKEPLLLVLATCLVQEDKELKKDAHSLIPIICNIPTHLFSLIRFHQNFINTLRRSSRQPPKDKPSLDNRKRKITDPSQSQTPNKRVKKDDGGEDPEDPDASIPKKCGWGRMRRKGVASFYTDPKKSPFLLLFHTTKYKKRCNLSHKQVLHYCHPKVRDENKTAKELVFAYATRGIKGFKRKLNAVQNPVGQDINRLEEYVRALEDIKKLSPRKEGDRKKLVEYIKEYKFCFDENPTKESMSQGYGFFDGHDFGLAKEHIPNGFYDCVEVYEELLENMSLTCLVRSLGKMSKLKLFNKDENIEKVIKKFEKVKSIERPNMHPIQILIASIAYRSGKSLPSHARGVKRYKWEVSQRISDALTDLFWNSVLKNGLKTGKRFMITIDVSDSMKSGACDGCQHLTPAQAAAAMALVTWHVEPSCKIFVFGEQGMTLEDLTPQLKRRMDFHDAIDLIKKKSHQCKADASRPMLYAKNKQIPIDMFVIFTDSDTWKGRLTPATALKDYRRTMNLPNSKLVMCGLQTDQFSIADPNDPRMIDICGFDSEVPRLIKEFALSDEHSMT